MEASDQLHAPGLFTPGTHWTGGWVGRRTGLDPLARDMRLYPKVPGLASWRDNYK